MWVDHNQALVALGLFLHVFAVFEQDIESFLFSKQWEDGAF
jgi:hypothetical protein